MNTRFRRFRKLYRSNRHGSIYVAVLGVAMIVAVIAMTSIQLARIETRTGVAHEEMTRAQLAAQSAIELALAQIDLYPNWRTDYTHGVEVPNATGLSLGTMAKYKFVLLDEDGDLTDDTLDKVTVQGIGLAGSSTSVVTVALEPSGDGLTCLETSLHSDGNLAVDGGGSITADQTVSSNGNVDNSTGGNIAGDAWAAGNILGIVAGNSDQAQTPAKVMPNTPDVFEYYISNGTQIAASDTGWSIDKQLISPNSNPYGIETNAEGIYVIDCQGADVEIKDSRIQGTLVLLNAGAGSKIDKGIHWEPAIANYPALMVQGSLEMKWHGDHNLRESQHSVSFNPVGTPFEGSEDSDTVDEYLPLIKGLVYVSGDLTITDECILSGAVVVGGTTTVRSNLTLTYDPTLLSNPPPGFADGSVMQIVPGTWQRSAY